MRTTLGCPNGVGEGVDGLGVRRAPLHRDLRRNAAIGVLGLKPDDLRVRRTLLVIQMLNEVSDAALVHVRDAPTFCGDCGFLVDLGRGYRFGNLGDFSHGLALISERQ